MYTLIVARLPVISVPSAVIVDAQDRQLLRGGRVRLSWPTWPPVEVAE